MALQMNAEQAIAFFTDLKRAYQQVFNTSHGRLVLDDLGLFCRARRTCLVPNNREMTFVLEGRREVFLRIRDVIDLSIEELVRNYTREGAKADG
jgi:hypothetical protein